MTHGSSDAVAIDVVLIPPPTLAQHLRDLNAHLAPPPVGFRFDETHLPHLTLVQLFVPRHRLTGLASAVEQMLEDQAALALHTTSVTRGPTVSTLGVAPSATLTALHRQLARGLHPFALDTSPEDHEDRYEAFVHEGESAASTDRSRRKCLQPTALRSAISVASVRVGKHLIRGR